MENLYSVNGEEVVDTPLLLFECTFTSGAVERWSSHAVEYFGQQYRPVLLRHNAFELRTAAEDGVDGVPRISVTLANADSHFSELERAAGWKGAKLVVRFLLYNLVTRSATTDAQVVFKGVADAPDEITDATLRVSFSNRLSLRRTELPQLRIQRQCPWTFPKDAAQRAEATGGGSEGDYSPLYWCGYSPDQPGGSGNVTATGAYTTCDYSRSGCEARGMFGRDADGRVTRRFGGIEYVPSSFLVRTNGEKSFHSAAIIDNEAKYNDVVPLVYGTAWVQPPIILARNDGNLTHVEVLISAGEIQKVLKVIVNNEEIPEATRTDMSGTGWFRMVSTGQRNGDFNADFLDGQGRPSGDPYGGLSVLSIVVPNRINDGSSQPRVQVLLAGLKLPQFDESHNPLARTYSSNPAWVLLDLLRRTGWTTEELNLASFARSATFCDEQLSTADLQGNSVAVSRFRCNLVVRRRVSAADLVRGIRKGAGLLLRFDGDGRLEAVPETTVARQQAEKPACSNATEPLDGGWPAYEFGDGTSGFGGILRRKDGASSLRIWSRSAADSPNRFTLDFQDEFNGYQQDSICVVDPDDVRKAGQETTATLGAVGIPNFNQAARVIKTQLQRSVCGNTYVDFETGVRGFGIKPGDIITLTYLSQGFQRQPFRVLRISPGADYRTSAITAQLHSDAWYEDDARLGGGSGRETGGGSGIPRPISGVTFDEYGETAFGITEEGYQNADGAHGLRLRVEFRAPQQPARDIAAPLVSLAPQIDASGGLLLADSIYYYAVAGANAEGVEGPLSFLVRAAVPAGPDTYQITITDLKFAPSTRSFSVYRGTNSMCLSRIAQSVPISSSYRDGGATEVEGVPADANYDHANFYWRHETATGLTVATADAAYINLQAVNMLTNEHAGSVVRVLSGAGKGQERVVVANSTNGLSVDHPWAVTPCTGDQLTICEAGWRLAAVVANSPAVIEVPNREGAFVQICGRAANVGNREAAYEYSPVTRWRIGGSAPDADVPGEPVFALSSNLRGTCEIGGISFASLTNTRSITAGTLSVHYFDEIGGDRSRRLSAQVDSESTLLQITGDRLAIPTSIQLGGEVIRVVGGGDGGAYDVERGASGSNAEVHEIDTVVYPLERRTYTLSFPKDFFGTPASGSYTHEVSIRNARIAFAELSVMNCKGNSQAYAACVTGFGQSGLRTLSGGQFCLQVDGYLAIQTNAVPAVVVDDHYSVRDIRASVGAAPSAYDVQVRLNRNGAPYAVLTIASGMTRSDVTDGFTLGSLRAGDELTLDVVSVGQVAGATPGRDLTVTVRV